jgi:aryl-alcohol dehydrogenase-like predicted oxidoreductase
MEQRRLGRSPLTVAPLAFGGNVFGWTADEKPSFALLDAFVDAGFNLVDTANTYSTWAHNGVGGQSETILGKWFARSGKRDRVVLATKVGSDMGADGKGLSKSHIQRSVEDSLRRLQTDRIDLYQAHIDDEKTPQGETLEAFNELVTQGKVRVIGASNFSATRLKSALTISESRGLARYESLQPEYNLYDREGFERELAQLCEDEEVGVIPYFSLAAGFLTGKYRSEADLADRARAGTVKKYLNPRGIRILDALDNVAADLGTTPTQIALAWLLTRPAVTAPIASATSLEQLQDLISAVQLRLDPSAVETLNAASATEAIAR